MSEYIIQSDTLTNIANSIRSKTGGSSSIPPEQMSTAIDGITSGGRLHRTTVTISSAQNLYTTPLEITGVPFTPKGFTMYLDVSRYWGDSINLPDEMVSAIDSTGIDGVLAVGFFGSTSSGFIITAGKSDVYIPKFQANVSSTNTMGKYTILEDGVRYAVTSTQSSAQKILCGTYTVQFYG